MKYLLVTLLSLAAACSDDEARPDAGAVVDAAIDATIDAAIVDAATCASIVVGGHCWYKGALGDSCTTTCTAHGGASAATVSFAGAATAGSRANQANCQAVVTALAGLPFTAAVDNVNETNDYGCVDEPDKNRSELVSQNATLVTSAHVMLRRFCACNQ